MTARSLRRAQERRANKLARKADKAVTANPSPIETGPPSLEISIPSRDRRERSVEVPSPATPSISPSQLAANRANAQLSTGAKTPEGKAKSCLNAVKTALTGRTVLLPSDDTADYESHIHAFEEELQPVGARECELAQSIADIWWRMRRAVTLQMAIFARGYIEFADHFDDRDVSVRRGLIEVHTFLTYEKQLRNLQLQEARLSRRREKETAELGTLQQDRQAKEREQLDLASKLYVAAQHDHKPFDPAANGFEFSTPEIEHYLERIRAAQPRKTTAQAA